jgi:hypothetical protein
MAAAVAAGLDGGSASDTERNGNKKRNQDLLAGHGNLHPILPPGRVHLGWSSWALHWMSRNPVDVPDHVLASMGASAGAHEAVKRQVNIPRQSRGL